MNLFSLLASTGPPMFHGKMFSKKCKSIESCCECLKPLLSNFALLKPLSGSHLGICKSEFGEVGMGKKEEKGITSGKGMDKEKKCITDRTSYFDGNHSNHRKLTTGKSWSGPS